MNERYLFRGKQKDNGKWVEGDLMQWNNGTMRICVEDGDDSKIARTVIPETVGQCTGLKDKNGKLIFEGDVVIDKYSCESFGFVGVVIYNNELTQFQIFNKHQPQYVVNLGSRRDSIRILGNIHDNPEWVNRSDTE